MSYLCASLIMMLGSIPSAQNTKAMTNTDHAALSSPQRLRALYVLARITWLQAVRSKLLWISAVFGAVLVISSVAAASAAIGDRGRLIIDMGLSSISALGTVMAVTLALIFFAGDIKDRTAYPLLARPISRGTFLLGKFFGLWLALAVQVLAMGALTAGVAVTFGADVPPVFGAAVYLTILELGIALAIGFLFSTIATPALAASYATAVLIAGNLNHDLLALAARRPPGIAKSALTCAFFLLPDLARLSLRAQAANQLPLPDQVLTYATAYSTLFCALTLALACVILRRRQAL